MKLTKNQQMRVNQILRDRDIDWSQAKHINCVRLHPTETPKHFMRKCELAYALHVLGRPFLTEVWTRDHKQRFDFLDLVDDLDYEIETGKSKDKKYKGDVVVKV